MQPNYSTAQLAISFYHNYLYYISNYNVVYSYLIKKRPYIIQINRLITHNRTDFYKKANTQIAAIQAVDESVTSKTGQNPSHSWKEVVLNQEFTKIDGFYLILKSI
jgi:hypothetical protein